jgi:hypothetical protein
LAYKTNSPKDKKDYLNFAEKNLRYALRIIDDSETRYMLGKLQQDIAEDTHSTTGRREILGKALRNLKKSYKNRPTEELKQEISGIQSLLDNQNS